MTRVLKVTALVGAALIAVGVVFSMVGFVGGGARYFFSNDRDHWGEAQQIEEPLNAFENIRLDGALLNVEIMPSQSGYGITLIYSKDLTPPEYRLENGTLTVTSRYPKRGSDKLNGRYYDVLISCPYDTIFEKVETELSVSDMKVWGVDAKTFQCDVNVFDLEINDSVFEDLNISGNVGDVEIKTSQAQNADISLSMGDFDAEAFDTKSLRVNLNVGDMNVQGTMEGKTMIDVNMGDVNLYPSLSKDLYYIDLKRGGSTRSIGAQGKNEIEAIVSLGEIDVDFDYYDDFD